MAGGDGSETVRVERSDVRRNRARLLRAGRELLSADPGVALYEVALRAEVGQATLYRHFPDRGALASAVIDELLDEIEAGVHEVDDAAPGALLEVIERICAEAVASGSLYSLMRATPQDHRDVDRLKERMSALVSPPWRHAVRTGEVRTDVTVDDVLLMVRMVTSAVRATVEDPIDDTRREVCRRAVQLAWNGVATQAPRPAPARRRRLSEDPPR